LPIHRLSLSSQVAMSILFLDQSANLGGAELCLLDIAQQYRDRCTVGVFADGPFRQVLGQQRIKAEVLSQEALTVRKHSSVLHSLGNLGRLLPLVRQALHLSRQHQVIYANTPKALIVGAIASAFSRRPLIYHLHDILSAQHFSKVNLHLAIACANGFATRVIANSEATQAAFVSAGGHADLVQVVYNGFSPQAYQPRAIAQHLRSGLEDKFVVGHFSRLSPWKGQHVLLEALTQTPEFVVAVFVGDALFGEDEYVQQIRQQVEDLGLQERVKFVGFQPDVAAWMQACDLVAHTSTAPEPFGRVIVEAMLCGRPVVASAGGGAVELVQPGITGWLTPPENAAALAQVINRCLEMGAPELRLIAGQAKLHAESAFNLERINAQLHQVLAPYLS
jgi:glycosyltransferase involved in cell wall biosynthesis